MSGLPQRPQSPPFGEEGDQKTAAEALSRILWLCMDSGPDRTTGKSHAGTGAYM